MSGDSDDPLAIRVLNILLEKLTFQKLSLLFLCGIFAVTILFLYENRAEVMPVLLASNLMQYWLAGSVMVGIIAWVVWYSLSSVNSHMDSFRAHVDAQVDHLKEEIGYLRDRVTQLISRNEKIDSEREDDE